jgi:hypothetical protein
MWKKDYVQKVQEYDKDFQSFYLVDRATIC